MLKFTSILRNYDIIIKNEILYLLDTASDLQIVTRKPQIVVV